MRCIEVCLSTELTDVLLTNVDIAIQHSVSRLELCSAMNADGLTPSLDAVKQVCSYAGSRIEVLAMIRPHGANFCYKPSEIETMLESIDQFADLGVAGVVFGVLDKTSSSIDIATTQKLVSRCHALQLKATFHRAFDALESPTIGVEQLISLGVDRVLTSGTHWQSNLTAVEGLLNLSNAIEIAAGRLEIVIGGGVSSQNAARLLDLGRLAEHHISLHAYSGVHDGQYLDVAKVKALVNGR